MATKATEKGDGEVLEQPASDSPLLDLSDAAVKRMIKLAKKRGFVTYAELNAVLPSEEVSSDQIEDVYAMLSEMGITVSEGDDPDGGVPKRGNTARGEREAVRAKQEQEAKRRRLHDGPGDPKRTLHDKRCQTIRQNVRKQDAPVRRTEAAGRRHELAFTKRKHTPAHQARIHRHAD